MTTFIAILVLYLLPTFVAGFRGVKKYAAIAIVNLFLGWTFVGWVVALAWAASGEKTPQPAPPAA